VSLSRPELQVLMSPMQVQTVLLNNCVLKMQLVTIVMPALLRTTKDDAVNKSEYTVYLLYTCNMVRLSRNNNNKC